MDLNNRVEHIDEELKLLKNEIKQVLLEVQEHVLNVQNPFAAHAHAPQFAPPQSAAVQEAPVPQQAGPASANAAAHALVEEVADAPGLGPMFGPGPEPRSNERPARRASLGQPQESSSSRRRDSDVNDAEQEYAYQEPEEEEAAPRTHAASRRAAHGGDLEDSRPRQAQEKPRNGGHRRDKGTDLITLAGLAQWCDRALRRIGKENFEILVQVSEMTGRISKEYKEVLLAFIPMFEGREGRGSVSAKEIVSLLAQLDGLAGTGPLGDTRMLSFLLHDDTDIFPFLK